MSFMCEYGFSEGQDFNLLKIERVQQEGTREETHGGTSPRRLSDQI